MESFPRLVHAKSCEERTVVAVRMSCETLVGVVTGRRKVVCTLTAYIPRFLSKDSSSGDNRVTLAWNEAPWLVINERSPEQPMDSRSSNESSEDNSRKFSFLSSLLWLLQLLLLLSKRDFFVWTLSTSLDAEIAEVAEVPAVAKEISEGKEEEERDMAKESLFMKQK